jgi:hypothetical protein
MEDRLYKSKMIDELEKYKNSDIIHTIGVDGTFDDIKSYCLTRTVVGEKAEVILTKSVVEKNEERATKSEFQIEVENLAKYFNAEIIGDWDKIK